MSDDRMPPVDGWGHPTGERPEPAKPARRFPHYLLTRRFWWWFKFDTCLIAGYVITQIVVGVASGNWGGMLTVFAMLLLLVSIVLRSMQAYRIGFAMGIQVIPIAATQPTSALATELVERSSELWDPPPAAVAHTMAIERLEREVNGGSTGP